MKRHAALRLALVAILGVFAWEGYRYRVYIENRIWHLRHGQVVAFADYVVPAPNNWYVEDGGEELKVLIRLDSAERTSERARDKKVRFPATLTLGTRSWVLTTEKLNAIIAIRTSFMTKDGVEPAFRTFNLDGETLSCIGGEKFSRFAKSPQFYEKDPNIWQCYSAGRLELSIAATDADIPQVWEIVSHIHKKS